jgi:hypothetical protein
MLNGMYDNNGTGHREQYLNGVLVGRAGWVTLRVRPWGFYNDVPKGMIMRGDPNWRAELQVGAMVIWPGDQRQHAVLTVDQADGTCTLDNGDDDPIACTIAELG